MKINIIPAIIKIILSEIQLFLLAGLIKIFKEIKKLLYNNQF